MQSTRRAVIDVGTNSVKLLVAEVSGKEVRPLFETSRQTRLGQGFYETHQLLPDAISATAEAVARFAGEARARNATSIRVIATSAAREAANAGELVAALEDASGLPVQIISGEQEAAWVFQGVTTDAELARGKLLLLDVGGGSTEFVLGEGGVQQYRTSVPLGTVRIKEQYPQGDPPAADELEACRQGVRDFLDQHVRPKLQPLLACKAGATPGESPVKLVGTGGTATILACVEQGLLEYDRGRIEDARISRAWLRAQVQSLWGLSLAARKKITGLPPSRADVILGGVVIYEAVMEIFGFQEMRVSTRGLRFAAVLADSSPGTERGP